MKKEIDILIEELEKEERVLLKKIQSSVDEWDFISAESYRKSIFLVRKKLDIVRGIKTPDADQIWDLEREKRDLEELLQSGKTDFDFANEEIREKLKSQAESSCRKRLNQVINKLANLRSIGSGFQRNNDVLLKLLESLDNREIEALEIHVDQTSYSLFIESMEDTLRVAIRTNAGKKEERHLSTRALPTLRQLGFDQISLEKTIGDCSHVDPWHLLGMIATIFLDVFECSIDQDISVQVLR